jgi:hypothetical protein
VWRELEPSASLEDLAQFVEPALKAGSHGANAIGQPCWCSRLLTWLLHARDHKARGASIVAQIGANRILLCNLKVPACQSLFPGRIPERYKKSDGNDRIVKKIDR